MEQELLQDQLSEVTVEDLIGANLVVYNDDHNSFDWVIECFVKYIGHTPEQAEQCAWIIHNNGKCSVKKGTKEDLLPIKVALTDAGLSAEIQ